MRLPAARKKGEERRDSAKSDDHDRLAGCARTRQNYVVFCRDGGDVTAAAKAQRSMAVAAGENRGGRKTTPTASQLLKDGQEVGGSHDRAFSRASATPKTATTTSGSKEKVADGVA